jgi:hypothetical protein
MKTLIHYKVIMKKIQISPKGWMLFLFSLILIIATNCNTGKAAKQLSIITDPAPTMPVLHALTKLKAALDDKKISYELVGSMDEASGECLIVAGQSHGEGSASLLLNSGNKSVPESSEGLTIWRTEWKGKPAWVVSGYDERGLMYGLLDVANRIGWSEDRKEPMREVREITEKPDVSERAVSIYTMNRAYWESRFYNEDYWTEYLDMLAENRFNSLVIIFGYENGGFMAPCYPYFFNVDEYPEIEMVGLTAQQQQQNLDAFNRLIGMAHERSIKFKVGIWDHIYRGGVQGGGIPGTEKASDSPVEGLVWGVNDENLIPYTEAALAKLIKVMPGLDGIQFRMHNESGVEDNEQATFWKDVFDMIKENAPDMSVVLRAKGMKESVIQSALDAGINFSIGTKYWMEQMGMPFHPTHINVQNQFDRRHGYADMLTYPQQYRIHWRLWNGGTTRILLWGNPDYARRFAESTHLYGGDGFEVNEPLATKMLGQPHDTVPFDILQPPYRYYEYEFERYWHFFQVFGRLGYNPETSDQVWKKEFESRFGKEAAPIVERALHLASWILPRVVSSVYNYSSSFPTTRGWPEKQRLDDLPVYARGEGSDIQQFASFDDEARMLIEGGETARILPSENSLWLEQTSRELNRLISEAQGVIGNDRNKEFNSTMTDLRILSNLALYHARRIPAAVSYCLYERTGDVSALEDAIDYERSAIEAWKMIVEAAGDVYAEDLMMGVRKVARGNNKYGWVKELSGHWKDELVLLEKGLERLDQERTSFSPKGEITIAPHYQPAETADKSAFFRITHQPILSAMAGQPIELKATVSANDGVKWVRLCYRSVNQQEDYRILQMLPEEGTDIYRAIVPAREINPVFDFMYFIEVMDNNGKGTIYPDLQKETPYKIVKLMRERNGVE